MNNTQKFIIAQFEHVEKSELKMILSSHKSKSILDYVTQSISALVGNNSSILNSI
jgi:hypothetical protein